MTYLNFTDRTSYFAARAEWKNDYLDNSEKIRKARTAFIEAQREYSKGTEGSSSKVAITRAARHALSRHATELLATRAKMKVQSQAQYVAAHASVN